MTPADLITTVRDQVYESSASFWTDAELYRYATQAEQEIADLVECSEATDATTSTVSGTQEYAKPTDCEYIKRVTWDGMPLKRIDFRDKDTVSNVGYGTTTDTSGQPEYYYEWGANVGVFPVPTTAKTLKFWYVSKPAALSAASTAFTVPNLFHSALVDYVLYRMYAKDQDDQRSGFHKTLWDEGIFKAKVKWGKRQRSNRIQTVRDEGSLLDTELGAI